jgi:hypothetical protein
VAPEVRPERAPLTVGHGATMPLADRHEERVVLVEQDRIARQMRLEELPCLLVAGPTGNQAVAREHPADVGVSHEDRTTGRVEQDRVHRLGPEPTHLEQRPAELDERGDPHAPESSPETGEEPSREGLEPLRLHPIGPGGADDRGELGPGRSGKAAGRQQGVRSESGHGPGGIRPCGVLREHGAHGDLERRPSRPPALGTEPALQREVEPEEPGLDQIGWWPWDSVPPRAAGPGSRAARPPGPTD